MNNKRNFFYRASDFLIHLQSIYDINVWPKYFIELFIESAASYSMITTVKINRNLIKHEMYYHEAIRIEG